MSDVRSTGLRVARLTKTYAGGVCALDGVDLEVESGMYGLLGPNGAGKSTLMRTLATLQTPDSGSINFDGVDVLREPGYLRQRLGYLPQHIGAYPGVSGRALLERFAWLKGRTERREREREVSQLLERVNLSDSAHRLVTAYSGGMLRRLGIALALLASPRLLIVDEPTAGLDPAERNRFHRVLGDVATDAVVLLSTHIVEDIENLCGRLSILSRGRVVAQGTPAALTQALAGRLWTCTLPRGVRVPEGALHVSATPTGTRIIVAGVTRPSEDFAPHQSRLEDAYHHALGGEERQAA